MAYIEKSAFEDRNNTTFDPMSNITGIFRNASDKDEKCSAGFLCVQGDNTPCEGYTGLNNEMSFYMKAAAASDLVGKPIFACDTHEVNEVTDDVTGQVYKVGCNTLGIPAPAGHPVTFKRIVFDGLRRYRFGEGNLSAAISTNKFFTIANGLLVPAAAAPTANGTPYFKLAGSGNFIEGNRNSFGYYDVVACTAVSSVAAAG